MLLHKVDNDLAQEIVLVAVEMVAVDQVARIVAVQLDIDCTVVGLVDIEQLQKKGFFF